MALIENEEGKFGWLKKNGDWHILPTHIKTA
jgi:hypothetical protein